MPRSYPAFPERLPDTTEIRSGHYVASFARTLSELEEIQRLRFQVFNLELGEGLEESYATGRDEDPYDAFCHHLMVRDERTGEVVGTYRMQDNWMAEAGEGFYSDNEYQLEKLPAEILRNACELGRACISKEHRSGRVLFLLWRGLFLYLQSNELRYFFGCCSIPSQNPVDGWALHTRLRRAGHLSSTFSIPARDAYRCDASEPSEIEIADVVMPRLMRLYLDYGSVMCSEPALDTGFKTIDFLALFDRSTLPPKLMKVFQKDLL